MSGDALEALHEAVEAAEEQRFKRGHERYPFRRTVPVRFPSSGSATLPLAGHDLSSGGMGLLHSAFVHPGSACTVMLPNTFGQYTVIEATVCRCAHFRGLVHTLGVKFKTPINVRQHVALDPHRGEFMLGSVDPGQLCGNLLLVEDGEMDRKLVTHYLRGTRLKPIVVDSMAKAMEQAAAAAIDVVVLDYDLPDGKGDELARKLTSKGVVAPIVLVSAHPAAHVREVAKGARIAAVLSKPFDESTLLRALGEFLLMTRDDLSEAGGPVVSTLAPDSAEFALVNDFVQRLHQLADQLAKAQEENELPLVRKLALSFKGSAAALGFPSVSAALGEVEKQIHSTGSLEESVASIRTLIDLCKRAKSSGSPGTRV